MAKVRWLKTHAVRVTFNRGCGLDWAHWKFRAIQASHYVNPLIYIYIMQIEACLKVEELSLYGCNDNKHRAWFKSSIKQSWMRHSTSRIGSMYQVTLAFSRHFVPVPPVCSCCDCGLVQRITKGCHTHTHTHKHTYKTDSDRSYTTWYSVNKGVHKTCSWWDWWSQQISNT